MMKSQKNIILLVAFHIAVLLSPLLAKGFHHHENVYDYTGFNHEKTISQENQHCSICDFKYVNVISHEIIKVPSVFASVPIHDILVNKITFCDFVHYYSLRAPPSC
jgi:hypothetical protein